MARLPITSFAKQGQDCGHEHQFIVAIVTSIKPVNVRILFPFQIAMHRYANSNACRSSYFKILILTLEIASIPIRIKLIIFHTLFTYLKCKRPETKQMLILMQYFNLDSFLSSYSIFFSNIQKFIHYRIIK